MVYVHFAEGFEEVEAVTIVDLLRRAAIDVKMVSIMEGRSRRICCLKRLITMAAT